MAVEACGRVEKLKSQRSIGFCSPAVARTKPAENAALAINEKSQGVTYRQDNLCSLSSCLMVPLRARSGVGTIFFGNRRTSCVGVSKEKRLRPWLFTQVLGAFKIKCRIIPCLEIRSLRFSSASDRLQARLSPVLLPYQRTFAFHLWSFRCIRFLLPWEAPFLYCSSVLP